MSVLTAPGGVTGSDSRQIARDASSLLPRCISVLASLKLTVVLFVLGMVIVFIGSLAQARRDVWQVMDDYFRCYVAKIDVQDLFPPSMFGERGEKLAASMGSFRYIPFPGGWTIGWLMLFNLLAAHALTFRVRARGLKLVAGIVFVTLGLAVMALTVYTGNMQTGVETGNTLLSPGQIWQLMMAILGLSGAAGLVFAVLAKQASFSGRLLRASIGAVLLGTFLYYFIGGAAVQPDLSAMRILWQLMKGSACSVILLLGSMLLFEKRGGIALLHFGVALLMISELQVGLVAKETNLSLTEGEVASYARDIRVRELAIISRLSDGRDDVVVVPEKLLVSAAPEEKSPNAAAQADVTADQKIELPDLPFDIAVRRFYRNSELRALTPADSRLDDGLGSFAAVKPMPPVTGMDDTMDQSSVLIDLVDRQSGSVLKSMLISQNVSELNSTLAEKATIDEKDYYFYLRFQRNYKPYSVKLLDVSRTTYVGSSTPRDFRSSIEITQDNRTERFTLWMNNPLRYRGETFYQSNYLTLPSGQEASTLSVVRNSGWMLPYIACMVVAFGMFAQFGQTLMRFLGRLDRQVPVPTGSFTDNQVRWIPASGNTSTNEPLQPVAGPIASALRVWLPILLTGICVLWLARGVRSPQPVKGTFNLYAAAQLPVAWNGRAQPLDSVARTLLLMTSHKSTLEVELEAWQLNDAKVRQNLLNAVQKAWPEKASGASFENLKTLQGSYADWISALAEFAGEEQSAIEERLRPLMVRKAPAIHWLLDLILRPELAERHRVIRINDDQLLALLSLKQRPGFVYSLAEIRPNLQALDNAFQKGNEKRREKREYDLTTLERRVGALFDTMGRLNQVAQVFQSQPGDNLLESSITVWRILQRLGESKAVMAVPTGTDDETRSWETFIVASSLAQLNRQLQEAGISGSQQFADWIRDVRPLQLVQTSVKGTWDILKNTPAPAEAPAPDGTVDVAKRAADALQRVEDPFLNSILKLIADAGPGKTGAEIAATVTKEQAAALASQRIAAELFEVISELQQNAPQDRRVDAIRARLQAAGSADENSLMNVVNQEIAGLLWSDLQKHAAEVMPGGAASQTFNDSAAFVSDIFNAWKASDAVAFNTKLDAYQQWLKKTSLPHVDLQRVQLEAWFNYFEPFWKAIYLYVPIILIVFVGWLFPLNGSLQRSALFLLVLSFIVHTFALWLRMKISGRPPVTNLYSSAIFIGWGVVIAAFFVELFLKNGIGSLVGASTGSAALVIAHYLALDEGDTIGVMQAVLDTAFWLATHVVCITLGYSATFAAGFLGVAWCTINLLERLLGRTVKDSRSQPLLPHVGRLVYGTLCFALFFSLVGTVLGGLWADDSWGRFWGWDPKENGAMLIVMWNAVILHARWDKMVGDFGTSVLSMFGNIVTAWSWFGVNELRAGLHSYGFTEGRLYALAMFFTVQMALIALFLVFGSGRQKATPKPVAAWQ